MTSVREDTRDALSVAGDGRGISLVSTVQIPMDAEWLAKVRNRLRAGENIVALLREKFRVIGSDADGYTIRESMDAPVRLYVTRAQLDGFAEALTNAVYDDMIFLAQHSCQGNGNVHTNGDGGN